MNIDVDFLYRVVRPTHAKTPCQWQNCNEHFSNDYDCFEHVKKSHSPKSSDRCYWNGCSHKSQNSNNNLNHIKKHFCLVQGICLACSTPTTFKWRFDLKRHIKNFHLSDKIKSQMIKVHGIPLMISEKIEIVDNASIAFLLN